MGFVYLLQRRLSPLDSQNMQCLAVTFEIYQEGDEHNMQLGGTVDWQDGVTIWNQENIEPADFPVLMSCAYEAIKEARTFIGARWKCNELK